MHYQIIHPEAKNPAEWWTGNPRVVIDFHYGELTQLCNRLEQLAKKDTSAYPMDGAMMLLRELMLIRDKAALERQVTTHDRLNVEMHREVAEATRRANLLEQDCIIAEQDLSRLRQTLQQRDKRISTLNGEVLRLEADRRELERIKASTTRFTERTAPTAGSVEAAIEVNDEVLVIGKHLNRKGEKGTVESVNGHGPYNVKVRFGNEGGLPTVYRPEELRLVARATLETEETAAVPV